MLGNAYKMAVCNSVRDNFILAKAKKIYNDMEGTFSGESENVLLRVCPVWAQSNWYKSVVTSSYSVVETFIIPKLQEEVYQRNKDTFVLPYSQSNLCTLHY